MAKKHTFSLHKAKDDIGSFDDLLTDTARARLRNQRASKITTGDFADDAALFVFPGDRKPPSWVSLLSDHFHIGTNLWNQSNSAVLTFKTGGDMFAVTFAFGHVYLDYAKTVADFGLRVAINFVSDEKLRSVERSNIGAAIRDVAHAATQKDLHAFGFDDALDLIRKVTGNSDNGTFADKVTGARALAFTKEMDVSDIPTVAAESVTLFRSNAYQKTSFKVLDFLSPVADIVTRNELNEKMVEAVRASSDDFELGLPEIVHDGIGSYRFEGAKFAHFQPDLSLEYYRESLAERLAELTVDDLKKHHVAAYSTDENSFPLARWTVHHALVGSIEMNGGRYALNEGEWYQIDDKFKLGADNEFDNLVATPDKKLRPLKQLIPESSKKGKPAYQSEDSYNKEIATETGYLLLDQKLVQIQSKPGPGVEVCDLLDLENKRLIHIKKSSRQSSVLSHFFKQGSNSAQLIRRDQGFFDGVIKKVAELQGAEAASKLQTSLSPDGDKWTVEFQIADFPRSNGKHNIPFFSKLSLREEANKIRSVGFGVRVGFITLAKIKPVAKSKKAA